MFYSLQSTKATGTQQTADLFPCWPAVFSGDIRPLPTREWRLEITGLVVEAPVILDYEALLKLPQTTLQRRIVHADGWSYETAWQGVLFSDLLGTLSLKPGVRPETCYVHQESAGGERECLRLQELLSGQALLCHHAGEQPLPELYGGPVRLLVFNRYAHKGLSQLTRLSFEADAIPGDWADKGYDPEGRIQAGNYYACDLQKIQHLPGT